MRENCTKIFLLWVNTENFHQYSLELTSRSNAQPVKNRMQTKKNIFFQWDIAKRVSSIRSSDGIRMVRWNLFSNPQGFTSIDRPQKKQLMLGARPQASSGFGREALPVTPKEGSRSFFPAQSPSCLLASKPELVVV